MDADVVVVGAGAVGLATARELLSHGLSVVILEREHDVGRGASGRNSGVVHSGFVVEPGTLKARLNVEGARMLRPLCAALGVPLREVGTLVVASVPAQVAELERLRQAGEANGLADLEVLDSSGLEALAPELDGVAALHSPSSAIVDPFALVLRLADAVVAGGGEVLPLAEVAAIQPTGGAEWRVGTADGREVSARVVVNATGVAAPTVSAAAGGERFESAPCRGEYLVLDRDAAGLPSVMAYPVPPATGGLGVHFTPTVHGTTLVGPSAEYVDDAQDEGTTSTVLEKLAEEARALCPAFDAGTVIASFAGIRAKVARGRYGETDFVIEESRSAPGLINLVGIESPGLTASPAIARAAALLAVSHFPSASWRELPAPPPAPRRFAEADHEARAAWAHEDPDAAAIVCRCEQVSKAEVLAAMRGPLGARSLTGVRARCRAGSGRCQGAFCGPRVIGLVREVHGLCASEVTLKGPGSEVLVGDAKELLR